MLPGKANYIGTVRSDVAQYVALIHERFSLRNAVDGEAFWGKVKKYGNRATYDAWQAAHASGKGTFLDHTCWGSDRDFGGGRVLYGAMDDRYASNAARLFRPGAITATDHVRGKTACVVGAWDGTECLLLRALGAEMVDAIEEVPAFCEMAHAQYEAWAIPGTVLPVSLYDADVDKLYQRYDLLYVPGVMYHLTDIVTALTMLWAMLKPSGVLAFETMVSSGNGDNAVFVGSRPGWNWWCPTEQCFVSMMRECGFQDARCVEHAGGRGWFVGSRSESPRVLSYGAAGFSRPDVLRIIKGVVTA